MSVPVLKEILRQHAEMAAFLWMEYDHHLLHPEENPEMDEVRLARLVERLDAHLDGLRVAGEAGLKIAQERYEEYPEAGELFVSRMLQPGAPTQIAELEPEKVRRYLETTLAKRR